MLAASPATVVTKASGNGAKIVKSRTARMLREVESKRKILSEIVPLIRGMDQQIISEWGTSQDEPDEHLALLKIMAAVWSDHPDYQPDWA